MYISLSVLQVFFFLTRTYLPPAPEAPLPHHLLQLLQLLQAALLHLLLLLLQRLLLREQALLR